MLQTNGRTTDALTDAQRNNAAIAHPYHERKRCWKFGRIPPSGLGGDSVTYRRTDGQRR